MWKTFIWIWIVWSSIHGQFEVKPIASMIEHGGRDKPLIALTFDACMTPGMMEELKKGSVESWYNQKVVDILHKNNVPATFFVSGLWAKSYPEVVKQWAGDSLFEIENHSWDHAAMALPCYGLAESPDKSAEVNLTQEILHDLTGRFPRFFRFPGGCYAQSDLDLVAGAGVQPLDWDVISGDSFLKDHLKIEQEVLKGAKNGSIVVMHVVGGRTAPATAEALQGIIDGLRKKGYSFVKVEDIVVK